MSAHKMGDRYHRVRFFGLQTPLGNITLRRQQSIPTLATARVHRTRSAVPSMIQMAHSVSGISFAFESGRAGAVSLASDSTRSRSTDSPFAIPSCLDRRLDLMERFAAYGELEHLPQVGEHLCPATRFALSCGDNVKHFDNVGFHNGVGAAASDEWSDILLIAATNPFPSSAYCDSDFSNHVSNNESTVWVAPGFLRSI